AAPHRRGGDPARRAAARTGARAPGDARGVRPRPRGETRPVAAAPPRALTSSELTRRAPPESAEPRLQLPLELPAAAGRDDRSTQLPSVHHADRRHLLHPELLGEVGAPVDRHPHELEGVVVAPPLQHLRDEALDAAAATRERREEEHETRLLLRRDR